MQRREFLGVLAGAVAAAALARPAAAAEAPRPNILLFIADDLACHEVGCFGGKNAATPNIDAFAREGLRFTQAVTSCAMCVPFRTSLYTGLYPARHGAYRNHRVTRPEVKTLPPLLKAQGYRVGLAGKSDVYPARQFAFEPVKGFQPNCVAPTADYTLDGLRGFLTRDPKEPFCLVVGSTLPHAPWTVGDPSRFAPEKLILPPNWVDTPATRANFAKYLAEVEALDRQFGDVLRTLAESGRAQNTLVFFCGEQGPQFPGAKWTCYDQGLHSALIARWPGRLKPNTTTDALIQYEDFLPTLLELAGGTPPENLDGQSFRALLAGEKTAHRDYAFAIHNNVPEGTPYPVRAIRTTKYKLILNLTPERPYFEKHMMEVPGQEKWHNYWHTWEEAAKTDPAAAAKLNRFLQRPAVEFYDLEKDPWELTNLADKPEHAATIRAMESRLRAWMKQQGDTGPAMDIEDPATQPATRNAPREPRP